MSLSTLFMKSVALVFAIGSGYFIGKEGPFVHLSACIANNLCKLNIFRRIHKKNTFRRQVLAIAAGVGVTATFGTPIGGCLYSIETVISFIAVNHIWKSFLCSFITAVWLHLLSNYLALNMFARTSIQTLSTFHFKEVAIYFVFGLLVGIVGVVFVYSL